MVPSTMSISILLIAIGSISIANKIRFWVLIFPILLWGLHTGGAYYAVVVFGSLILFYVIRSYSQNSLPSLKDSTVIILGLFFSFALIGITKIYEPFQIPVNWWDYDGNYFSTIGKNIAGYIKSDSAVVLLIFILVGLWRTVKGKWDFYKIFCFSFSILFFISFLYVLPHNYGDVPRRFAIIAGILNIPLVVDYVERIIAEIELVNVIDLVSIRGLNKDKYLNYTNGLLLIILCAISIDNIKEQAGYRHNKSNYAINLNLIQNTSKSATICYSSPVAFSYLLGEGGIDRDFKLKFSKDSSSCNLEYIVFRTDNRLDLYGLK
jgi:hypothetical protein